MQWICSIAMYLVLSGIILELIADTKYYKFARWVAGVILLLQFLKPMTDTEEVWNRFTASFRSFDYAIGTDRVLEDIYKVDEQAEYSVLKEYKEGIAEQINRILQKNGLNLVQAEIDVAEDGTIENLWIWADYLDGSEERQKLIPTVVPVRIGEKVKKDAVSPFELYIRELLAEFYQVEENTIEVVIQEAE